MILFHEKLRLQLRNIYKSICGKRKNEIIPLESNAPQWLSQLSEYNKQINYRALLQATMGKNVFDFIDYLEFYCDLV